MRFTKLDRQEFAALLERMDEPTKFSSHVRRGEPEFSPELRTLWVCWDDESSDIDALPRLVVVADEDLNDFFAWAVTFLSSFRPLSSFMRVLPWSEYSAARESHVESKRLRPSLMLGAILGETLMNATGRGFIDALPITAFESTYFAALSQALSFGASPRLLSSVDEGWNLAKELTDQRARRIAPNALSEVSQIIFRLAGLRNFGNSFASSEMAVSMLVDACREIQTQGTIPNYLLEKLSRGRIPDFVFSETMRASKERRVEAFENSARLLMLETPDQNAASFIAGYLANLVSDGSLEHAHLVFPLQDRLPTAMLWYGICAGLSPNNRIQSDYSHLGLRIQRWLSSNKGIIATPACDISIHELVVLLRGDPRSRSFRQTHSSFLRVEIAPTITTVVKWPGKSSAGGQLNLFAGEDRRLASDPEKLNELIRALHASLSLAEGLAGNQQDESKGSGGIYRNRRRTK